jgi:hypothetical protein
MRSLENPARRLRGACRLSANQAEAPKYPISETLRQLHSGQLFVVSSRRRNGLILFKRFHAEFAGPGSAVGGTLDRDCEAIIEVGNLLLQPPQSREEQQKAYLIRRQWIRLTHQLTEAPVPLNRAQMILSQFENYFDSETIAELPSEAFARLVGVFPLTVRRARQVQSSLDFRGVGE